jgi:hypothetical protein
MWFAMQGTQCRVGAKMPAILRQEDATDALVSLKYASSLYQTK